MDRRFAVLAVVWTLMAAAVYSALTASDGIIKEAVAVAPRPVSDTTGFGLGVGMSMSGRPGLSVAPGVGFVVTSEGVEPGFGF